MMEDSILNKPVIPFLKWAGGKRWLVATDLDRFLPLNYNNYFEPFLGSAAVFFHLQPVNAILGDYNQELIDTYNAIKDNWEEVLQQLEYHHKRHSNDYYYRMREYRPKKLSNIAARFIYLNRTCWNGLYRVNLEGKFNVPRGTKKNVVLETDDYEYISSLLKNAEILCSDFEEIIDRASEGDLIYVDPPYTVKHNQNGFIKYNEKLFSWDDQIRLRDSLLRARNRGAHVIVSNADHRSIRDLYRKYADFFPLKRNSIIAGDSSKRGIYDELVIVFP